MACNGVMAWGMAEWSNGGIDGNGRMAGMARMMVSIRKNDRIAEWQ